jgi:excisionase family DNA binding protein
MPSEVTLLTVEAVATRLGVGRSTVQRLIRDGALRTFRKAGGRRLYVTLESVEQCIATKQGRRYYSSRSPLEHRIDMAIEEELEGLKRGIVPDYVQRALSELASSETSDPLAESERMRVLHKQIREVGTLRVVDGGRAS